MFANILKIQYFSVSNQILSLICESCFKDLFLFFIMTPLRNYLYMLYQYQYEEDVYMNMYKGIIKL